MNNPRGLKHIVFVQCCIIALVFAGLTTTVLAQTKSSQGTTKKSTGKQPSNKVTKTTPATTAAPAQAPTTSATTAPAQAAPRIIEEPATAGGSVQSASLPTRSLKRPKQALKFIAEERRLSTTTGSLWGTLLIPTNASTTASIPIVLIINTSTVYDRDGISTLYRDSSSTLKFLAEALAAEGIASLRYDTRGVGKSQSAFVSESYHDFNRSVTDACGWIDSLRKDKRLGALTVIGFGRPSDFGREGGLAGIVTAVRQRADGLICIGTDSRRWLRYIRGQVAKAYPEETAKEIDSVAALMEQGQSPQVKKGSGILYDLLRPSLQKYILSLNEYEPITEIAKLSIPIIAIHGTLDYSLADVHLRNITAANPRAKYYSIKNMTFNLKEGAKDLATAPSEKWKVPIMPEVINLFADSIWEIEKQ